MYLTTFKFYDSDIQVDIHDIDRVCRKFADVNYFVTPSRYTKIKMWMLEHKITKVYPEDAHKLIALDMIGTYKGAAQ